MALKGLVIRKPWIGMILRGEKTWELRGSPCQFRGRIALIEKGSGHVQGIARLIDDLPRQTRDELLATSRQHGVPIDQLDEVIRMGWVRPWVLTDIVKLSRPVPYQHTSGGSWVNLTAAEEAAVLAAANHISFSSSGSAGTQLLGRQHRSNFPNPLSHHEPAVTVNKRGNQIAIEMTWEEPTGFKAARRRASGWKDMISLLSGLVAMASHLGFILHFGVGIISDEVSAMAAFKWAIPFVISSFIHGMSTPLEHQVQPVRRRSRR